MKNIITNSGKLFFTLIMTVFLTSSCKESIDKDKKSSFRSLKYNNSNMRIGPGKRFDIKWNFKKVGLPIKIIQKYEEWYEVETPDGSKGWMHKRLFLKKKTIIFIKNSNIYIKPDKNSKLIATIDKNSVAKITSCKQSWCKIENENFNVIGYVIKNNIWGAIVSETK